MIVDREVTVGSETKALLPWVALVGVAYIAGGQLGSFLSFPPEKIATFWPPNAFVLAALLLFPRRDWWLFLLVVVPAELVSDALAGIKLSSALGFTTANIIELLIAALMLDRLVPTKLSFRETRQLGAFILSVIVATSVSAVFGAATVLWTLDGFRFWPIWLTWVLGDGLAHLALTPTLVVWLGAQNSGFKGLNHRRTLESLALALVTTGIALAIFLVHDFNPWARPELLFLPLPALLWLAVRFGARGLFAAATGLSLTAVAFTLAGFGPFSALSGKQAVASLQIYLVSVLVPLMFLATLIEEQWRQRKALQEANENLEKMVGVRTRELSAAKDEADRANAAKSLFLANMSHEIVTPMTVFMVAIEHLLQIDGNPEHREFLEMADKAADRLHLLVDDILDISRIEAKRVEIHEESFDLRENVNNTLDLMRLSAQEKNLRLEMSVSPEVPQVFLGDSARLGQILTNLVGNAVKFTEEGMVRVSVQKRKDSLVFSVCDTGPGIPEEKRSLLFQTFGQVDDSLTRKHRGTGLGLAICKGLVERMGGEIWMEAGSENGSVFKFTLPLKGSEPGKD